MEDSSTKGLKQERKKRQRVARIKTTLICVVSIWLLVSMIICTALVFKVYMLEEKLDYLIVKKFPIVVFTHEWAIMDDEQKIWSNFEKVFERVNRIERKIRFF